MAIIEFLQRFSNPVLDWFMRIVTEGGDVTFAIVVGVILYWLVDKKFAYKMTLTFLFSAGINGGLKQLTQKNRPYQDGAKAILQETTGSSMPSGHSQNIAVMATMMGHKFKDKLWVKITAIVLLVLVPLSRMYLGQHYLDDVLVGVILGVGIAILSMYVLTKYDGFEDYIGLGLIPVFIILMIIFNKDNQIFVAGGALVGLTVGYFLEKRFVDYDVKAPWKTQIFKLIIGLAVALGLKEGLKVLFKLIHKNNLLLENIFDAIRYLLVSLWATLGAMALFKAIFPNNNKQEVKETVQK